MTRSDLQQQLTAIEAFMASPAYAAQQLDIEGQIAGVEDTILFSAPITAQLAAEMCVEFGKRELLYRNLETFKEQCDLLKRRIASCDADGNVVAQE